jgi:hypothetical protein
LALPGSAACLILVILLIFWLVGALDGMVMMHGRP